MIKIKVSEASDTVLDYMAALALGHNIVWDGIAYWISDLNTSKLIGSKWKSAGRPCGWSPSSYWEHGGPIIEREKIGTLFDAGSACRGPTWFATPDDQQVSHGYEGENFDPAFMVNEADGCYGPTPLIAAMRCFVTSKLGEEVEVPDGLVRVS